MPLAAFYPSFQVLILVSKFNLLNPLVSMPGRSATSLLDRLMDSQLVIPEIDEPGEPTLLYVDV
jgi:hypothetical protein